MTRRSPTRRRPSRAAAAAYVHDTPRAHTAAAREATPVLAAVATRRQRRLLGASPLTPDAAAAPTATPDLPRFAALEASPVRASRRDRVLRDLVGVIRSRGRRLGEASAHGEAYLVGVSGREAGLHEVFPEAFPPGTSPFPPRGSTMVAKIQVTRGHPSRAATATNEFAMHCLVKRPGMCADVADAAGAPRRLCTAPLFPDVYAGVSASGVFVTFMEHVPGRTLQSAIEAQHGKLTRPQLDAIHAAVLTLWANGVSHNDLHARNVLLTPDGGLRLIDLGLSFRLRARATSAADVGAGDTPFAEDVKAQGDAFAYGLGFRREGLPPEVVRGVATSANSRTLRWYRSILE